MTTLLFLIAMAGFFVIKFTKSPVIGIIAANASCIAAICALFLWAYGS